MVLGPGVQQALALIESADLEHVEHKLLTSFVQDAVEPTLAAKYILHRLDTGESNSQERTLRSIKNDWRTLIGRLLNPPEPSGITSGIVYQRDHGKCCITQKSAGWLDVFRLKGPSQLYIIPPSFTAGLESEYKDTLAPLLDAFITPPNHNELREMRETYTNSSSDHLEPGANPLPNILFMAPDAKGAFQRGEYHLVPYPAMAWSPSVSKVSPAKSDYILTGVGPRAHLRLTDEHGKRIRSTMLDVVLATDDPDRLPLPSPLLLSLHSRFSSSLQWSRIEDQVRAGWPSRPWRTFDLPHKLKQPLFRFIRAAWLSVPQFFRIRFYFLLLYMGSHLYGSSFPGLQRVPFGLFIKYGRRGRGKVVRPHEAESLALLEKYTDVPAPRLIELTQHREETYMIMTRVPGQQADSVFHLLTYKERERLASDLRHCVAEFRQIPNKNRQLICDTTGGPVFDYRIDNDICGPFISESEFNECLATREDTRSAAKTAHSKNHRIYFTHSDLGPANILIKNGKLAGIVDFGCSGFLPEYWEYTKAMFDFWGMQKPWVSVINGVFGSDVYKEELQAEVKMWEYRNPW